MMRKINSSRKWRVCISASSVSHQRSFEIWCGRRRPGGRYDAVDWVLLLGVDVLHVEWGTVLGLALGLLGVQAAVHATVAILRKECINGLYPGLSVWKCQEKSKEWKTGISKTDKRGFINLTHHDGFSLKCFYFLSQVFVGLQKHKSWSWGKSCRDISTEFFSWRKKVKFNWRYLLSIRVWLECDIPVVVVCELDTYHLWTVVIFEQWLHFLKR